MRTLSIDLETYSPVDLKKAGLYKYVASPDFTILLFAYAYDDQAVEIVDFAQGEQLPPAVVRDLNDPAVIKRAYNAAFEWQCLSKWYGMTPEQAEAWLPQWRCTQLHGLYCGYTAGLGATGEALGLPQDKRKLSAGSALIKTFCVPCEPTSKNGHRTRTLPHHEPDRWALFRDYCVQDVVTEREIARMLSAYPVPDEIQAQWVQDQTVNARGVQIDMDLVRGAIQMDETITTRLMAEAVELSGLSNPKSRAQLKAWLEEEIEEALPDLRKDTVTALLGKDLDNPDVRRMLELRQALAKSSTAKYKAMAAAVCDDGRVRGTLMFYGANRTGRWAGRIIQPQNLPRMDLPALDTARGLVTRQNIPVLTLCYGSIPHTLSQLIRTAIVAPEGKLLISADFSAIEARIIAWLAGEQWVMDVFASHGKIYEAAASQMFGVPIDRIAKGNPEYELRQRGKVATLALGYQGGVGSLLAMHALDNGLTEDELPDIVARWRKSNPRIVDLWYACDAAAVDTVQTGRPNSVHGVTFALEGDATSQVFLTIRLPCGRKLYYARPHLGVNQWGRPSIGYWGVNDKNKWGQLETYGGKLTENIVQATARDCLALAIERLEAQGYKVLLHVHDEVILEVDEATADQDLQTICEILSIPIPWAPGLILKASGYTSRYYKKD